MMISLLVATLPAGLSGSLDEGPLHSDGLAEDFALVELLLGGERLLVRLVLHEGVPLQEARAPVQVQMNILRKKAGHSQECCGSGSGAFFYPWIRVPGLKKIPDTESGIILFLRTKYRMVSVFGLKIIKI